MKYILPVLAILVIVTSCPAEEPADTVEASSVDSLRSDTLVVDTTLADSIPDSLPVNDTAAADTSMVPADSTADFAERLAQYRERQRRRAEYISWDDSLAAYMMTRRLDQFPFVSRTFWHDAGGYFRGDPSFFMMERQVTPMRTAVSPFGLSGQHLGIVNAGMPLQPFQHNVEPDGLTDMNLLPTASDQHAWTIAGPAGMLFGSPSAVASLVTLPMNPESDRAYSSIRGEKGGFSYSWVRGMFVRHFEGGKRIEAGVGYREAEGPSLQREDDTYHYSGNIYLPFADSWGFTADGRLVSRDGYLAIRPDQFGASIQRDGFNRQAELAVDRSNEEGTARYEVGYRHLRQGSNLNGAYRGRFNYTGHAGFLRAERVMGQTMLRANIESEYLEYDPGITLSLRRGGDASLTLLRMAEGWRWAALMGGRYDQDHGFLPRATLLFMNEGDRHLFMGSVGYLERAPTLHEMNLPRQVANVYPSSFGRYADEGNPDLEPERQLVGSVRLEHGDLNNALVIHVTGGHISSAIDWLTSRQTDTTGAGHLLFRPENTDVDFMNTTVMARLKLADYARLRIGGAHHLVKYAAVDERAYSPDYQFFGGLELHYRWESRLTDFYLYSELVYTGPYDGYLEVDMGRDPIINIAASLGLKDFRFYLIWQNMLSRAYKVRDFHTLPGRFFYYGIAWQFLD